MRADNMRNFFYCSSKLHYIQIFHSDKRPYEYSGCGKCVFHPLSCAQGVHTGDRLYVDIKCGKSPTSYHHHPKHTSRWLKALSVK